MSMSVSPSYPRPLLTPGRIISTHTHTHTHTLLPVTIVNTACSLSPDTLHTHITGHLTPYTLTHTHTHTHTRTHTHRDTYFLFSFVMKFSNMKERRYELHRN